MTHTPRISFTYAPRIHVGVPSMQRTLEEVAYATNIQVPVLQGRRRERHIVRARQLAMIRIRDATGRSLPEIGRLLNRDHTTVLHALRMRAKVLEYWETRLP